MTTLALHPVAFPPTDDTLWAAPDDGATALVAIKPICRNLGLNWSGQFLRIKRDPVLSEGICKMQTPSQGGVQDTVLLPLKMIPGWLFGIDSRRVKAPSHDKLIAYQKHCYEVLWAHFGGPAASPDLGAAVDNAPAAELPHAEWRIWIDLVRETRMLLGRCAATALYRRSPLPQPEDGPEIKGGTDVHIGLFFTECTVNAERGRVAAAVLYAAYTRWCAERRGPPLGPRGFGLRAGGLGYRRLHSNGVWYCGLGLKESG